MTYRVLIVDDDQDYLDQMASEFIGFGFEPILAASVPTAKKILNFKKVDLVVTDFILPEQNGLEFKKYIQQHKSKVPVLIISGFPNVAKQFGDIEPIIYKPFESDKLIEISKKMIEG